MAEEIEDDYYKSDVLSSIALSLVQAEDIDNRQSLFEQALRVTEGIED